MLFYKTIDSSTLELLKELLAIPLFKEMRLAGGTSLALQLGHRKSIDLDFFGQLNADDISIAAALANFNKISWLKKSANINILSIDQVKVDFVNYTYPWISDLKLEDGIRLAGLEDIAAMKLAAITGRGSKKDFIDLYFLFEYFSLQEMIGFYHKKYADGSEFLVLKSLCFFDDAEEEETPILFTKLSWGEIKKMILEKHKEYVREI